MRSIIRNAFRRFAAGTKGHFIEKEEGIWQFLKVRALRL